MNENKQPKVFSQCPNCGSRERLIESVINREKEAGHIPAGAKVSSFQVNAIIANPALAPILGIPVPCIVLNLDACAECGTMYCLEALEGQAKLQPMQPPGKLS